MKRIIQVIAAAVTIAAAPRPGAALPIQPPPGGCTKDSDCLSRPCAKGVCIENQCGFDPSAREGAVCRSSTGPCDPAEVCNGVGTFCPGDVLSPSTTVCRAAAGECDVAEHCTGTSAACPADGFVTSGTVCRGPAGPCDAPEVCDGAHAACPADAFLSNTTVCRQSAGPCDVAEKCTGTAAACPADAFVTSGTVCRAAAGACDVAEVCDGAHAACPADALLAAGKVCRAVAGACDVAEVCDGTHVACPADALLAAGTVCRTVGNDCDVAESCTGTSKECPADASAPPGTACENASACVAGGACQATVCVGGTPELTFTPDPADFSDAVREIQVAIKHTGAGAPIGLAGASIDPPGKFLIATAPEWPVSLPSGSQAQLTLRLTADAAPGDHVATLLVQAQSCADQPLQLHATVASPTPDAGTDTPDAGIGTPGGGSGSGSGSSGAGSKSGGCSSGGAAAGTWALLALALGVTTRRRPHAPRAGAAHGDPRET